jgi:ATP-dependent helicase/nuclease subunit A
MTRMTPSSVLTDTDEQYRPARSEFVARTDPQATAARDRGRLVHRLLQSLPDIAPESRAEVAARYLEAFAPKLSADDRAALAVESIAVIGDPAFADAFAAGSRAEVEIAGRVTLAGGGEAAVAGRVDRLAVSDRDVLIVDYKTNRPAPTALADVPEGYIAQLALYRALLRRLYPGKIVAAALLWTDRPALMAIPDDMLNRAESTLSAG